MRFIYIPLCIAILALAGCKKDAKSTEAKEERSPLIKQGHAYMEIKDYDKATDAFKQAIDNEPRMARPYLDLATIYHQHKPDYINSIFYYKRYLELRPDSEKAEFINEQIQEVQIALANAILTQSGAIKAIQELKQLRQENAKLKKQLAARPKTSTQPAPVKRTAPQTTSTQPAPQKSTSQPTTQKKSVTQTIPKTAKPTYPTHEVYTVVAGDNLTKIANKFYGDGDYDDIYEANKDRMKSPGDLRIGQTLVIPLRSN
ncbi:MAG: LysM peptidoglycan-binding domain-containing protein [Verrucomicrobiota bacterium]